MSHRSRDNDQVDGAASKEKQIEDSQVDSGFISSDNLLSSQLSIESEYEEPQRDADIVAPPPSNVVEGRLVDLGLDDDLGKLSLKDATTDNQLDSGIIDTVSEDLISGDIDYGKVDDEKIEPSENIKIAPWQLYYAQDDDGDTQLHLAIIQEFIEAVFYLIDLAPHPCLLDIQNDEWMTPLHLAVLTKQSKIVRKLILAGADLTLRNFQGDTPLHLACELGALDCVKAFTNPLDLSELSSLGNKKLTFPQDLQLRNYNGQMCLHIAAKKGHIDMSRCLLSAGANVNAREDLSGCTALHIAIGRGYNDLALVLVQDFQAKIDSKMYSGRTAYGLARRVNLDLADDLLKFGTKPSQPLDFSSESESDDDDDDNIDDSDDDIEEQEKLNEAIKTVNMSSPLVM